MVLICTLRSSASSGKDKDYYNARRKLFKCSIHEVLRDHRGLSEWNGESHTRSHLGWVLKNELEFSRRGEHPRKDSSHVQRQRDTKEQGHDIGCAGILHVRDGRGGLVGREAEDVSLTLLSEKTVCFFLVWGRPGTFLRKEMMWAVLIWCFSSPCLLSWNAHSRAVEEKSSGSLGETQISSTLVEINKTN